MAGTAKLPIGIEDFEELRRENFYYVDKTGMIRELLENWGKVNLFTRPRRFGKSLNMSTLKYFLGMDAIRNCSRDWRLPAMKSCAKNIWGSFR